MLQTNIDEKIINKSKIETNEKLFDKSYQVIKPPPLKIENEDGSTLKNKIINDNLITQKVLPLKKVKYLKKIFF